MKPTIKKIGRGSLRSWEYNDNEESVWFGAVMMNIEVGPYDTEAKAKRAAVAAAKIELAAALRAAEELKTKTSRRAV